MSVVVGIGRLNCSVVGKHIVQCFTTFLRKAASTGACGVSPVRRYIPELLEDVLEGNIHPGLVFDFTTDLNGITEAYVVMDERRAIQSLVQVGTI